MELDLGPLPEDKLGFLPLLFGPDGLRVVVRIREVLNSEYMTNAQLNGRLLGIVDEESLSLPEVRPNRFTVTGATST